ncbi:hypothetical protein MMC17_009924 [Xylographa soralifera]|nr:hypothetical protein [Xylographa soralifera]
MPLTCAIHSNSSRLMLVLFVLAIFTLLPSSSSICYTSAGTQSDSLACSPDEANSMCCETDDICLSNGLCQPANDTGVFTQYHFFGCTDPTWNAPECHTQCQNCMEQSSLDSFLLSHIHLASGDGVLGCSPGNFCCYGTNNSGCCEDSSNVFDLGIGTIVTVVEASTSMSGNVSTTIAATAIGTVSFLSAPTITRITPTVPTTPSAPASSTPNTGVAIAVGLGAGIPASVAMLVGLYYLLVFRPKRQHTQSQSSSRSYQANETETRDQPIREDAPHELRAFQGTDLAAE